DEARMTRIRTRFTRAFVEEHSTAGLKSIEPIFIASLPRSGSTLIEQMLAAHSQINGGGEMPHLAHIANALERKWQDNAGEASAPSPTLTTDIREAAREYQNLTRHLTLLQPRFTDKGLSNFLHAGLIHM